MADDWRNGGFGLYVHWPFCEAKCPYCDFNSHVSINIDQKQWLNSYLSELRRSALETPDRVLNTIFFGGGTPSLMHPDSVAAIIDEARSLWRPANDMEITLEANPGSVEAGRFAAYRDAGINRISMGVQALNDDDLRRLGRIHTVAEAQAAFDIARACFDRVSFDLIYARQHQTLAAWRAELTQALSMAVDHLSLYQLTIEDGTAFGDRYSVGKLRGLPEDDSAADMYLATQEICEAHGLPAYEVSNHARPGAESRHNLIYWRYGDYVGIGPGAHGRITLGDRKLATETHLMPNTWLDAVQNGSGERERTELSNQDQAIEYLMMCLRLKEGLYIDRYEALSGSSLPQAKLDDLNAIGMIEQVNGRVIATKDGRAVLNSIIRELLG
ncbi:Oxygen-independent coproporphyrinogen-III oxidase 1 [Ruegeria sp. THAF57]|uniref:radical SAM family heme chaperone HemW n=1 Tax=Ruegeria sp. THAF57 TaxID=2744555 RepID=UPI0015DE1B0D|nr:radical SAM family heme chaperone HemW [Ruegeria sp. THAF57]CAD0184533.1 Oxygen-independent coproporphyrinogen-III oxidase 1 [Ruegeria sp. THAF57]